MTLNIEQNTMYPVGPCNHLNVVKVCVVSLGLLQFELLDAPLKVSCQALALFLNLKSQVLPKLHGQGITSLSYQVSTQCLNCLSCEKRKGNELRSCPFKGHLKKVSARNGDPKLRLGLSFIACYVSFQSFLSNLPWNFDFNLES